MDLTRRHHWLRGAVAGTAAALLLQAASASAGTVTLDLSYDGAAIADALPNHRHVVVTAYTPSTGNQVVFEGELAGDSVAFDLAAETYNLGVIVAAAPLNGRSSAAPGDLRGGAGGLVVPDQGGIEVDAPMRYAVHITSPLDNGVAWSGTLLSCPLGPEVPRTFTLMWEPVPHVTTYELILSHIDCDEVVEDEQVSTTDTSVEVTIDPEFAQDLTIFIRGTSDRGYDLVTNPRMVYDDAAGDFPKVHALAGGGRTSQPDALVALQVARVPGVGSSFWTSDLTVSNPSSGPATVSLLFTPRDADGGSTYETATMDLPARGTRTIRDVVGSLFGSTGAGSLELRPPTLQAWVRTSTPGSRGSFGQGYPMVAPDDARVLSVGGTQRVGAGGVVRGEARTNLALANLWGHPTSVRVRLFDRDGDELGRRDVQLRPFENSQLNDVVARLAGGLSELAEGRVTVEIIDGEGRVATALSIVDNGSDDPTTVMLEPY